VLVPLALIAWNEYRLSSGERIVLRAQPVDPNDPFRGEYVDLTYPISRLDTGGAERGSTVYVPLQRRGRAWTGDRVVREKPDEGTFIRGRVSNFGIRYGIETFFVEEGEAPSTSERWPGADCSPRSSSTATGTRSWTTS
jgi:uncharacterized membrane-anchored protein